MLEWPSQTVCCSFHLHSGCFTCRPATSTLVQLSKKSEHTPSMGNSFGKASTFPYRAVHILKIREHIDNPRDTNCTIMVWLSTLPHARSCTKKHVFNTACGRFWTIEHVNLMVRHRCPANGIVLESPVLQAALAAINGAGNMVTFMRQVTSGFS